MSEKKYTVKQIAHACGLSKQRINQYIQDGKISGSKKTSIFGDYWEFEESEAERFIEAYKKK